MLLLKRIKFTTELVMISETSLITQPDTKKSVFIVKFIYLFDAFEVCPISLYNETRYFYYFKKTYTHTYSK